ncbi:hypothetical protein [Saccharicrinis sp. GN24d3]|uniref:hypothetical protein n=1 Tax=Saccharicrinis sp. GN24d3 TaxID=3458416 RepID=UPI004035989C
MHINCVLDSLISDVRVLPRHIGLYMALYFVWGKLKFVNPMQAVRHEIMPLSKIGSVNTFIRTIKELDAWGYISYSPSKSQFEASVITIITFDNSGGNTAGNSTGNTSSNSADNSSDISGGNTTGKSADNSTDNTGDTSTGNTGGNSAGNTGGNRTGNTQSDNSAPVYKLLNNNHISLLDNNKEILNNNIGGRAHGEQPEVLGLKKADADEKKKKRFVKPTLKQIEGYFKQKEADPNQAERFFNHFESNGWKVGGRSPMKDWKAAARNWILNISRYSSNKENKEDTTNYLSTKNDKDYGEPL